MKKRKKYLINMFFKLTFADQNANKHILQVGMSERIMDCGIPNLIFLFTTGAFLKEI